jgi:hypothetical protein
MEVLMEDLEWELDSVVHMEVLMEDLEWELDMVLMDMDQVIMVLIMI